MRKVLLGTLLSVFFLVLAGLFTVGYAQEDQAEEDLPEIRRWLIDRIEAAYTVGDADTLRMMRFSALAIPSPETDRLQPRENSVDGPMGIAAASKNRGKSSGCWPDDAVGPPPPGQLRCGEQRRQDALRAQRELRTAALTYYRAHFRGLRPDNRVYDYCSGAITAMYQACVLSPGPSNRNRTQGLERCTGATVEAQRCMRQSGYCPRCKPADFGLPEKPLLPPR